MPMAGSGGPVGGDGGVPAAAAAGGGAAPTGAAPTGDGAGGMLLSPMVMALTAREAQVRAAVAMVQEENVSVRQAARTFKLPKSTLHRYVQAAVRGGGLFVGNISPPQARGGSSGGGGGGGGGGGPGAAAAAGLVFPPAAAGGGGGGGVGGSPPDVPPFTPRSPPPTGFKRQRSSAGGPPPVTSPRRLPPPVATLGGLDDPRAGHPPDLGHHASLHMPGTGGPLAGIHRPGAHPSHVGRTHSAPSRSGSVPALRRPSPPPYARGMDSADAMAAASMVQIGQHAPPLGGGGRPAASPPPLPFGRGGGFSVGASRGSVGGPSGGGAAEGATGVNKSSIRFLLSESSSGDLGGMLQGSAKRRPTGSPLPPPPASPRVGSVPSAAGTGGHLLPSLQSMDTSPCYRSCHSVSQTYGLVRRDRTPPIS